ncbi:MAG TPA: serine hydrolase [Thermoanaerobaculia bacterium]|jgi:CubicO group peptidase (beta-lactamase class C family)|nr:serine hydrolase [Thermoanaerobaculia bacterium]
MIRIRALWIVFLLIAVALSAAPVDELEGLWKAKRRFGPDARGLLVLQRNDAGYSAEMVGRIVPVRSEKGELSFDLPNGEGGFRGRQQADGTVAGHWYPPNGMAQNAGGRFVSPVRLKPDGPNRWSGQVVPFDDAFTFYLLARKRPDGTMGVFLRNPERDFGAWLGVDRLVRDGNIVKLIGKRPGQNEEGEAASGTYDAESEVITLFFPNRGGSYDFRREGDDSDFYPRGKNPARYEYRPPPARDDGWPVGSLQEAGIDRAGIERIVQRIVDMPMESVDTPEIHGLLIARHGKLVLEEYFHGQHRDKLHETRSAAKSVTATVVGAAMQAGAPLELSTPVYKIMNGGAFPADLEPRKQAMTLEHLLTMSSGYFCDDTNPEAPGGEEIMINQEEEPDYYRFTLKVPMASAPGEKAVYCSASPNLALGIVGRATNEFPLDTFDRLLGAPMKIERYGWPLDPAGHPYGGGSVQLLPRDFMKFGQLMLNGGTWEGRRILSREFVARASAPLYHLRNVTYGYLWWSIDYPYKNRTVHAFYATGAGGQTVTVVPDLDLIVATFAGNYSSKGSSEASHLTPRYILPAVREPGDDPNAPVVPREDYVSPYGRSEVSGPVSPPR